MRTSALFGIGGVLLVAASCTRTTGGGVTVHNNPPTATITSPLNEAEFPEGAQINFKGLVADDGGVDELFISWTSSIDGVLNEDVIPDEAGNVEYFTASLSPGNHVVSLSVIDASAELGEHQVLVKVIDTPDNPTISIQHPSSGETGAENEMFRFMAQVADADDAPQDLDVSLASDIDGEICSMVPDAAGVAYCDAVLSFADHQLTFTVIDTEGNKAQAGAFFKVVPLSQVDNDGDGYTEAQGDCDDSNNAIHPNAQEFCNGIDDNCNGIIDEGTECYDDDGDGFTELEGDCNDANPAVHPDAPEIPNGIDDDCDGKIDNNTGAYDDDGDGYCETPPCVNASSMEPDCNDDDYRVNPGAPEVCDDGIDNNCNGKQQERDAVNCTTFYRDSDRDGYGVPTSGQCWCGTGNGLYTAQNTRDCYDGNENAYPGQTKWFTTHRGDGSFDYNCDAKETKQFTNIYHCEASGYRCKSWGAGWKDAVPVCGDNGDWGASCDWFGFWGNDCDPDDRKYDIRRLQCR